MAAPSGAMMTCQGWAMVAAILSSLGVPAAMIRVGSQVALIPLWFLAVYVLVALLVLVARGLRIAIRAALPGVPIRLHCLGWTEDPRCQLADLAARFR